MTNCELLLTKPLVNNSTYLTIITYYRPPNNNYNIFLNELTEILLEYLHILTSRTIILTVHFNFHSDKHHTPISLIFAINVISINITASQHIYTVSHFTSYLQPYTLLINAAPTNATLITDHYAIDIIINKK